MLTQASSDHAVEKQVIDLAAARGISTAEAFRLYVMDHVGQAVLDTVLAGPDQFDTNSVFSEPDLALSGSAAARRWFPDWRFPRDLVSAETPCVPTPVLFGAFKPSWRRHIAGVPSLSTEAREWTSAHFREP